MFSSLFTGKLSSSNNHLENSDDTGASRNKDDSMNDSIHDETLLYDKTDDACKENDVPPSFNENHIVEYSDNDDASNKKPRHTDAVIMAMDAYMDGFDNGNSTYEVGMNQSQCPVLENNEENVPQLSSTNDAYETMTIHNDPEKSMSTENEIYDHPSPPKFTDDSFNANEDYGSTVESTPKWKEVDTEAWTDVCADVLNDKNKGTEVHQKLQIFFDGMKDRSEAHSSFVSVYEQTEKSFDDIIQRALGVAVPIYEQTSSMVREMEQDLIACYSPNHHQREKLVQSLELYDNKWQDTFNSLMRRVIDKSMVAVSDDMSQMDNAIDETNTKVNLSDDTNSKVTENKASAQIDSTCVANTEDNDDADGDEPDWDMLVQFEPSRESIQIFLDYRDRWNVACGNFSIALDEIHDQFKSSTSEILRTVGTVYDRIMNEELEERQRDIQYNLTNNYRRRKFLETALDEAARQQQGMFMKLMARVSGALMPSGDKRPRSGTCTERHSI